MKGLFNFSGANMATFPPKVKKVALVVLAMFCLLAAAFALSLSVNVYMLREVHEGWAAFAKGDEFYAWARINKYGVVAPAGALLWKERLPLVAAPEGQTSVVMKVIHVKGGTGEIIQFKTGSSDIMWEAKYNNLALFGDKLICYSKDVSITGEAYVLEGSKFEKVLPGQMPLVNGERTYQISMNSGWANKSGWDPRPADAGQWSLFEDAVETIHLKSRTLKLHLRHLKKISGKGEAKDLAGPLEPGSGETKITLEGLDNGKELELCRMEEEPKIVRKAVYMECGLPDYSFWSRLSAQWAAWRNEQKIEKESIQTGAQVGPGSGNASDCAKGWKNVIPNLTREYHEMDYDDKWESKPGEAPFAPRRAAAAVVFKGRLWMIGGNAQRHKNMSESDVWSTEDGAAWKEESHKAAFDGRSGQVVLAFKDKLWMIGGIGNKDPINTGGGGLAESSVWRSSDGKKWEMVIEKAAFKRRSGHSGLVFKDAMWVMGGWVGGEHQKSHEVWRSKDGKTWELISSDAPLGRALVFKEKIWIFGSKAEIWNSGDGKDWQRLSDNADYGPREYMAITEHAGRLWMAGGREERKPIGGYTGSSAHKKDLWMSEDGLKWVRQEKDCEIFNRWDPCFISYKDKLWFFCGFYKNDVWVCEDLVANNSVRK
jgi:hypothetical protein